MDEFFVQTRDIESRVTFVTMQLEDVLLLPIAKIVAEYVRHDGVRQFETYIVNEIRDSHPPHACHLAMWCEPYPLSAAMSITARGFDTRSRIVTLRVSISPGTYISVYITIDALWDFMCTGVSTQFETVIEHEVMLLGLSKDMREELSEWLAKASFGRIG
jgi:hypothetical protein